MIESNMRVIVKKKAFHEIAEWRYCITSFSGSSRSISGYSTLNFQVNRNKINIGIYKLTLHGISYLKC